MSNALFQVRKESGDIVGNYPTLVEAVLKVAQFDGYGAQYGPPLLTGEREQK